MTRSAIHTMSSDRLAPRLHVALCHCIAVGVTLLVLLPAARGTHELIGWLPLWLLGMPLSALAVLHLRPGRRDHASSNRRAPHRNARAQPATRRIARAAQSAHTGRSGGRIGIADAA